jgi:FixJ family two-component response regulator
VSVPHDIAARGRVVLIEDDAALGAALKFKLMIEGYAVDLLTAAEPLLERPFPDGRVCLVTDLNLPGVSGLEAVEMLRARGVLAPALLITTQPSPAIQARAAQADAEIIEKPILGERLGEAIRRALDRL